MKHTIIANKLKLAVKSEKFATAKVMEILNKMEKKKVYLDLNYSSLFTYLVQEGFFSENEARLRTGSMRSMEKSPDIKNRFLEGSLTLTAADKLNRHINREQKELGEIYTAKQTNDLLDKIEGKPGREIDQILGKLQSVPPNERWVKLKIDQALDKKIETLTKKLGLKELEGNHQRLFELLIDQKLTDLTTTNKSSKELKSGTRYIAPAVKLAVKKRSGHQCEHIFGNGKRCQSTKFLEFDHIFPHSKGGNNNFENIQQLCWSHNRNKGDSVIN